MPSKKCKWKGVMFRSEFERELAKELTRRGYTWEYEPDKFVWQPPVSYYTPDFKVWLSDDEFIYLEGKGNFKPSDRIKMYCIKQQYPDLPIAFVFQQPKNKLMAKSKAKNSKTYEEWAEKYGFTKFDIEVPRAIRQVRKAISINGSSAERTVPCAEDIQEASISGAFSDGAARGIRRTKARGLCQAGQKKQRKDIQRGDSSSSNVAALDA